MLHGDSADQEGYVPYVSLDPLNDPKSFTFRIKVQGEPGTSGLRQHFVDFDLNVLASARAAANVA